MGNYSYQTYGIEGMKSEIKNQKDYIYLCQNYEKLTDSFLPAMQDVTTEFFSDGFQVIMLGLSQNNNPLMDKRSYFVTKVKITELYDIFFRITDETVSLVLDSVLGRGKSKFNLNKMSALEAKIITSYNDFIYKGISKFLQPAPPTVSRSDFDVINFTFLLKDNESGRCGKFIVTIPKVLLNFDEISSGANRNYVDSFKNSTIKANIDIGSTKFTLYELKHIAPEDIVIFENSNLEEFRIKYNDYENIVHVKPNMGLVLPIDENERAYNMSENTNLWDSIEVEINAQFDAVKITLGELKAIEAGTVLDLTSIYDNKVTLSVENKPIAKGELVIINDRYGVKISEVAQENAGEDGGLQTVREQPEVTTDANFDDDEIMQENNETYEQPANYPQENEGNDEDFDYSDFELEDEDI